MTASPLVTRMRTFGPTIFDEMSALARRTEAINLGQGFPDTDGPAEILRVAQESVAQGYNQYAPLQGFPELREAIAEHQKRFYGLDVDPDTQVLVTVGATEAITATILALCEPGDEVVMFEPYYDSYAAATTMAGATRRTSVLRFPDYRVDEQSLRAAFSDKTRMVMLNTPHNPTGKVFSREELELIASIAREYDAYVVTDEVYEHLVFDDGQHVPMASLPGMADRTLTISSGGKTFSVTGWKVGWVTGPEPLVTAVRTVKQYMSYTGSGPFQPAIAHALRMGDDYFETFTASMQESRDLLVSSLGEAGLEVHSPQGTYFVIADVAPLGATDAVDFCWRMPQLCGVVGVPVSVFHDDKEAARTLVRFAFCKKHDVMLEAVRRLGTLHHARS